MIKNNLQLMTESSDYNKPLLSIIVPVYKVEEYVGETLESIIAQDAAILDRTEVIIINDGSPDNSGQVCLDYVKRFPKLFRYIEQENSGVSVARNRGIEESKGKFVGFIDSDDKYSKNTLVSVIPFFEKHYDEVDVVAIPIEFFDGAKGMHPLNFKFENGTRVVSTEQDFTSILLHVTGAFFKRSALIESGLRFDSGRKYAEDKLFLTQLIQRKGRYGLVDSAKILYRKRLNNSSAIQGSTLDPLWYRETLWNIDSYLFWLFKQHGKVPRYVQYVVAYDVQWRVKQEKQSVLSSQEQESYVLMLKSLLDDIDPSVIMGLRNIYSEHKAYLLKLKFDEDPMVHAECKDGVFKYRNIRLATFRDGGRFATIHLANVDKDILKLEGFFFGLPFKDLEFGFVKNSSFLKAEIVRDNRVVITFLGDPIFDRNVYKFEVPIEPGDKIRPAVKLPSGEILTGTFLTKEMSRIPSGISTYKVFDELLLQNVKNEYLAVKHASLREIVRRELSFWRRTIRSKTNAPVTLSKPAVVSFRIIALILRMLKRNEIWIISDRQVSAGDNAGSFFRYISTNKVSGVRAYFLLSKESPEYKKYSRLGQVLRPGSVRARILFLASDKIISSQANDFVINVFGRDQNLFRDLYDFDFIFLQHGVILHDQSNWLNRFSKNIKLFVTSAPRERESIVRGDYGYSEKEVILSGLPRHDDLVNRPLKKIVVAPTWRHHLVGEVNPKTLQVPYDEEFKNSNFYSFYQELIENERLNTALLQFGYTAEFLIHPSFYGQAKDFRETQLFRVSTPPNDYNKAISEASVMVTDYSSVVFDFAYLRKPVVYAQFDREEFYQRHLWGEGYFDFDVDGFGPVVEDLDDLIDCLIEMMQSGAKLEPQFADRIETFFAYNDQHNSARVLQRMNELD